MSQLPHAVARLRIALETDGEHELASVGRKLLREDPELVRMWNALRARSDSGDDYWASAFVRSAHGACNSPAYLDASSAERRAYADVIVKSAEKLCGVLKDSGLDVHIVDCRGIQLNGFYVYEEFSEEARRDIDAANDPKVQFSLLVQQVADRARELLEEPAKAKQGANAAAIRFARTMSVRNIRWYGEPLPAVVAAATNAIFDTAYDSSEVSRLLSRAPAT